MKKIEITLNDKTGAYCIKETLDNNYYQGLNTYDLDEALLYLENTMEKLTYED